MKVHCLTIAILLVFLTGHPGYSQTLVAGVSAGVGAYSMHDLKILNEAVMPSFDCKLVSDFPPYFNEQLSVYLDLEEFSFGVFYGYQSTGSRISARDYSGEYRFDQQVGSHYTGLYLAMNLLAGKKWQLSVYDKPGISFTRLDISEYFYLVDTVLADEKYRFRATSFFMEPGIAFTYHVWPCLGIGLNAGYYLQLGGENFHLDGEKESEIVIPRTSHRIKPDWKGFRLGISVWYTIKFKDEEQDQILITGMD
jgi:hypothetical protein